MSGGIRERVLRAVVALGRVDNPHELQELAGADTHSIVHCLYALRADGLVTFKTTSNPPQWKPGRAQGRGVSRRVPTRVEPTARGIQVGGA